MTKKEKELGKLLVKLRNERKNTLKDLKKMQTLAKACKFERKQKAANRKRKQIKKQSKK